MSVLCGTASANTTATSPSPPFAGFACVGPAWMRCLACLLASACRGHCGKAGSWFCWRGRGAGRTFMVPELGGREKRETVIERERDG